MMSCFLYVKDNSQEELTPKDHKKRVFVVTNKKNAVVQMEEKKSSGISVVRSNKKKLVTVEKETPNQREILHTNSKKKVVLKKRRL